MDNTSLNDALQQYRVLHTPVHLSIYQFYAKQKFSKANILECEPEERESWKERATTPSITIIDSIKGKVGRVASLYDLMETLIDPARANIVKERRSVVYSSCDGIRPIGSNAYDKWNGFQVIDMDIKNREYAMYLKKELFKRLKKYNWFFGVAFSSSGKGLHIYTKIRIPQSDDSRKKKLLYLVNYRHKYSFVYLACIKILENMKDEDGNPISKDILLKWLDMAMFKPQQGAFIGYDPAPLINSGFFEDFIYVNFDNVEDMGHPDVDWVSYPDLKEIFKRWEWFEDTDNKPEVNIKNAPELEVDTHNKIHYKHFERWRLANTLVKLYGLEQGFKYMRMICSSNISTKEIQADCTTAHTHDKPIDEWAINQLNKYHGFNIAIDKSQETEEPGTDRLANNIEVIDNPTLLKESKNTIVFNITKDQYLGDIKKKLLDSLGMISLIDAGAGVGKTEMVKSLVDKDGKRILLVMPFTSTIKSKIEGNPNWDYSYGNKAPKWDRMGICMTIDKFSRINLMEVKEMGFDYIFIDESHLMFQSEYRPVMAKVVEKIRNSEVPIVLMSGTPVGETIFFEDLVHLKVIKEDVRKKNINIRITGKPIDNLCYMCQAMARDVANGVRVLFPTNKGSLFKEQIEELVSYFLRTEHFIYERPIVNYYKKSNVGEDFMDKVNIMKTVDKTNILLCSTYLSVGVDILDRFDFNIYFNDLWMPQEIEQFANRLRSHDLFINIFINRKNADGDSLDIIDYTPCNFALNEDEIKNVHSIVRACNAMIERNPIEYRYNSLVASIIRDNKFIEYNDVENKYYLNEIAYKIIMFERKYRIYVQQLPVLIKGILSYGYQYNAKELGEFKGNISEDFVIDDSIKNLLTSVKRSYENASTVLVSELLDIITEDRLYIYNDVMKGLYDIKKGPDWKNDELNKIMIVKNIEIFEKVVPLVVSLSKMFDISDIKEMFEHCRKNNTYSFAAIRRLKSLCNLIYNAKLNRLDLPIDEFMKDSYKFVDDCPQGIVARTGLEQFIRDKARKYAEADSTEDIIITRSPLTMEALYEKLMEIFRCLINVSRPRKNKKNKKNPNEIVVEMEKVMLMWDDKNTKVDKFNQQLAYLGDLLDNLEVKEERIGMGDIRED